MIVKLGSLVLLVMALAVQAQLKTGFYSTSCPSAESIVRSTVVSHFNKDPTIAPGLLRLHFHDCFVQVSYLIYVVSGLLICLIWSMYVCFVIVYMLCALIILLF